MPIPRSRNSPGDRDLSLSLYLSLPFFLFFFVFSFFFNSDAVKASTSARPLFLAIMAGEWDEIASCSFFDTEGEARLRLFR
jgi:hypothetical protein